MDIFKSRQDDPSNDTIVLMAHYMKHFTVSSMENKEFWEFYSNNKVKKIITEILECLRILLLT